MGRKKKKSKAKRGRTGRIMAAADDLPFLSEKWPGYFKPVKRPITLRVDADVLAWFKRDGRGYQTRMVQALRKAMMAERRALEREERS